MLQLPPRFRVECIITSITSVFIFYRWQLEEVPQTTICNPLNGLEHAYLTRKKIHKIVCDQSRGNNKIILLRYKNIASTGSIQRSNSSGIQNNIMV